MIYLCHISQLKSLFAPIRMPNGSFIRHNHTRVEKRFVIMNVMDQDHLSKVTLCWHLDALNCKYMQDAEFEMTIKVGKLYDYSIAID